MKVEDSKDGDVTPIHSLSDENKPSSSKKKLEPTSEIKPNFSRVTPAQLQYISFPSDGRYQPVRTVTSIPSAKPGSRASANVAKTLGLGTDRFGGGGGILILTDSRPEEEAEFIELETPEIAPPPPEVTPAGAAGSATGPNIALDESTPDAAPPEPFEVSWVFCIFCGERGCADCFGFLNSTLSTMTLKQTVPYFVLPLRFLYITVNSLGLILFVSLSFSPEGWLCGPWLTVVYLFPPASPFSRSARRRVPTRPEVRFLRLPGDSVVGC